jgi:hypothetical protein
MPDSSRVRKARLVVALAGVALAGSTGPAADAASQLRGVSARIKPPPEVQIAGLSYTVVITVRTRATAIPQLCIDFEDDNDSWLVRMPGLRAYDDDVFCFGRLRAHVRKKQFVARIIPAREGQRHLEIGIGNARLFPALGNAVLRPGSLWWSSDFVIIG